MYIQKAKDHLTSAEGFPDNWFAVYDFSLTNKDQSLKEIIGKVSNSVKVIFEFLNYSLISGEFVNNNKYKEDLNELKSFISIIQSDFELTGEDLDKDEIGNLILDKLAKPLNRSIIELSMMAKRFERHLSFNGTDELILDALTLKYLHRDVPVDDNLKLLLLNIKLCELDRNLSVDKDQLRELILIKHEIESETGKFEPKLTIILRDKCNYLIKKILYRLQQDEQTSYLYAFDYQDKELTSENVPAGCFDDFDQITKKHYSIDGNNFRASQIEHINEKIRLSKKLTCLEFHHLTKYYKDNNKNDIQVSNLINDFQKQYQENISSQELTLFDAKAFRLIRNYLANNKFSIFKDNHFKDIAQVELELNNVKQIQQETGVYNYFPVLQFAKFIEDRIQKIFNKKGNIEDYQELSSLIDQLKDVVKLSFINFEWSKDKNLKAFQLPYNECIIRSKDHEIDLFLSSSFVLPINYEKVRIELEDINKKLSKHIMLLEMHQNMEHEKQIIIELKTNVEKAERNSIQILGIFSAIIMFTASSIQIFSIKNISPDYAIKFMLAFGYSLVLFIFLIWLISRDNLQRVSNIHKTFFGFLLISTVIALLYVTEGKKTMEATKDTQETKANKNISHSDSLDSQKISDDTTSHRPKDESKKKLSKPK